MVGYEVRIRFWEDLWWGDRPSCSQFLGLYRVIIVENLTISVVLDNSFSPSWYLNFHCSLTNMEIKTLKDSCPHSYALVSICCRFKSLIFILLRFTFSKIFFLSLVHYIKSNFGLCNQIFIETKSSIKGQCFCLVSSTQKGLN